MARKKSRRSYHHGNLREALIEAAARVAAEDGVDAIQVKALATATGVSVAAPFRHFKNRQELLVAVAEEGARRQRKRSEAACAGITDPLDRAQASAVSYVRWAVEEPGYFRLLTRPELLAHSEMLQAVNASHREMLAKGLGRPRDDAEDPILAERSAGMLAAQAMVYGLARMLVDGHLGEVGPEDAETLARQLTEVLAQGLAGPPGDGAAA